MVTTSPSFIRPRVKPVRHYRHIQDVDVGREFVVQPAFDAKIEEYLRPLFQQVYTMSFENYSVELERLEHAEVKSV